MLIKVGSLKGFMQQQVAQRDEITASEAFLPAFQCKQILIPCTFGLIGPYSPRLQGPRQAERRRTVGQRRTADPRLPKGQQRSGQKKSKELLLTGMS